MAYRETTQEAQALVQQQLAAHGSYSPLELLLATNRLDYDAYRAWRRGECATLDAKLADGTSETRHWVERIVSSAQSLALTAETIDLYGIDDNAGAPLTASADARLDALLHTEFRPAADRAQLDLFLDTGATAAADALSAALASRDPANARARLQALTDIDPDHWAAREAHALIDALEAPPPTDAAQGLRRLETLERTWLGAACAVLRAGARDFLTPLWRDAGRALEGASFDPAHPKRHASWAYRNGLDWPAVARTVQAEPAWRDEPVLLLRLAEAHWRQRRPDAAVETWFALCWRWPERFEQGVESASFPNPALRQSWRRMRDDDRQPPIATAWFPAWLATQKPDIAAALPQRCADAAPAQHSASPPERAFALVLALHAGGSDRRQMDNRRALHALNPRILECYLESVDA